MSRLAEGERRFVLRLSISAAEVQKLYRGQASTVSATTTSGLQIRFPARELRPFVTTRGVDGLFELTTTADNKLLRIQKIS